MSKNQIGGGITAIVTGALIAYGPQSLFKICDQGHHHAGHSACYWTAQATIGTGIILAIFGIVYLFAISTQLRIGLSVGFAGVIALTFLIANVLIGMDLDPMMACRIKTLPALNVISIITFILVIANVIWLLSQNSQRGVGNEKQILTA
ncbi:MAG: DUF4418 family protein [Fusobacteriaceae bacterium]|jgi:hypothetical protein|nr:DUF4418 family protein [Fusobacteriaceae bacterium]